MIGPGQHEAVQELLARREMELRPVPREVRQRLEARIPSGTAWAPILALLAQDRIGLAVHRDVSLAGFPVPGEHAIPALVAPAGPDALVVHVTAALWDRVRRLPDRQAWLVARMLGEALIAPADPRWIEPHVTRLVLEGFRHEPLDTEPDEQLLARLTGWRRTTDPDHRERASVIAALARRHPDALPPCPRIGLLPGWLRFAWSRPPFDSVPNLRAMQARLAAAVAAGALPAEWVDSAWLGVAPRTHLDELGGPPRKAARCPALQLPAALARGLLKPQTQGRPWVVAICGGAATGKSTVAAALVDSLAKAGRSAAIVPVDAFSWPGEGFRYRTAPDGRRHTLIEGPGLVDHASLARAIAALRAGRPAWIPADPHGGRAAGSLESPEVVVVEGVSATWSQPVAELVDLRVGLHLGDDERLQRKQKREESPSARHAADVPADLAAKRFSEWEDVVRPQLERCDLIWNGETEQVLRRQRSHERAVGAGTEVDEAQDTELNRA